MHAHVIPPTGPTFETDVTLLDTAPPQGETELHRGYYTDERRRRVKVVARSRVGQPPTTWYVSEDE